MPGSEQDTCCAWCKVTGNARAGWPTFRPADIPTGSQAWLQEVKSSLPYLPQAVVSVEKYAYKGKKLMGKGPKVQDVSFIMTLPRIQRDLESQEFVDSLQCECNDKPTSVIVVE
jgi:hypothetical protein